MPRARNPSAVYGGSADETEANFYEALQHADLDLLMACWADEDDIVCIHPGGRRLIGVAAIRSAFETLFANGPVQVRPTQVQRNQSLACAVHTVAERVVIALPDGPQEAWVLATNVYFKTAHGWRLVAHHASPAANGEAHGAGSSGPLLH